ncbi:pyridoxal 5'-phosphate synthase glutaminase subunit PdxT [Homoserinimonas sp. OAct 916]|uniref:pyridoxal 5'-phosphate synthase glutaminase subunit PdxT n=1 Tax=Homoserinimonas sp. OAct 916 TaxID=2211450 RepID=UPI001E3448C6|nr:pyridoxal 5'-phosphate synthase glutaminase subunit PdxT [Homoserinimonas sp. OAct 916]
MAGNQTPKARVGVLALQGDFREHAALLRSIGADVVLVRRPEELDSVSGLVIPGGESTVMDKLGHIFGLAEPIRARIRAGMPVFGTCAGLIMLADEILDAAAGQQTLGALDITVRRNAFGSQQASFEVALEVPSFDGAPVVAVFIRAPIVERVGPDVEVLAALADGRIVAVAQGPIMGTSFHPEMNGEPRFHRRFLDTVAAAHASE